MGRKTLVPKTLVADGSARKNLIYPSSFPCNCGNRASLCQAVARRAGLGYSPC